MKALIIILVLTLSNCISHPEFKIADNQIRKIDKELNVILSYQGYKGEEFIDTPVNLPGTFLSHTTEADLQIFSKILLDNKKFPKSKLGSEDKETTLYANLRFLNDFSIFKSMLTGFTFFLFPTDIQTDIEIEIYLQSKNKKSKKYKSLIRSTYWLGIFPAIGGIAQNVSELRNRMMKEAIYSIILQIEENEPEFLK